MRHISFFAGTRGFEFAADMAGWETVASVEINEDLNRRFKIKYPNATQHKDIKETDFRPYKGLVDVISGGFPCQPYSSAGLRKGTDDERHLWPEMLRGIREISPRWVVGENVRGIVSWSKGLVFEQVCADLESEGYEVQPFILPAASINAPHERQRVWFVAHATGNDDRRNAGKFSTPDGRQKRDNVPEFGGTGEVFDTNTEGSKCQCSGLAWAGRDGFTDIRFNDASDAKCVGSRQIHQQIQSKFADGDIVDRACKKWHDPHTNGERCEQFSASDLAARSELNSRRSFDIWDKWTSEPPICGLDDGLPVGLDVPRLRADITRLYPTATEKSIERAIKKTITNYRNEMIRAFGNAVVPQLVYRIFSAINEYTLQHQ